MNQIQGLTSSRFFFGTTILVDKSSSNPRTNAYIDLSYIVKEYNVSISSILETCRCDSFLSHAIKVHKLDNGKRSFVIELDQFPRLLQLLKFSSRAFYNQSVIDEWKDAIACRYDLIGKKVSFRHLQEEKQAN